MAVLGGLGEGTVSPLGFWWFASTWPISSHFSPFLWMTGTLPAAAPVVNPRVGGFVYILWPCWPFKQWKASSFSHCSNLHWFLQSEVMGIYLPSAGTLGCVAWGWGHSLWRYPFHPFCHCHLSTSYCLSACLRDSTPPTCLDECVFFKSLVVRLSYSSIFWQFWGLFVLRSGCTSFCGCMRKWMKCVYLHLHLNQKCSSLRSCLKFSSFIFFSLGVSKFYSPLSPKQNSHLFAKSWSPTYSFVLSLCLLVSALTGGIFFLRLITTLFLVPSFLVSNTFSPHNPRDPESWYITQRSLPDHDLGAHTGSDTCSRSHTKLVAELELRFRLSHSQASVIFILPQKIPWNFLPKS